MPNLVCRVKTWSCAIEGGGGGGHRGQAAGRGQVEEKPGSVAEEGSQAREVSSVAGAEDRLVGGCTCRRALCMWSLCCAPRRPCLPRCAVLGEGVCAHRHDMVKRLARMVVGVAVALVHGLRLVGPEVAHLQSCVPGGVWNLAQSRTYRGAPHSIREGQRRRHGGSGRPREGRAWVRHVVGDVGGGRGCAGTWVHLVGARFSEI